MSCLDATFTLTPISPLYNNAPDNQGWIDCYGAAFRGYPPYDFSTNYSADSLFFDFYSAGSPGIDYSIAANRMKVPRVELVADLQQYGTGKSLALVFGFQPLDGRPRFADLSRVSGRVILSSRPALCAMIDPLT
jgi:hypothetical protein